MKKTIFLTAFICLLAISAFAQDKKADFSGTWTLDAGKSKLDERARVESMTLTVTQSDKEFKIETATKRLPPPEGMSQGDNGQGGGMRRGGGGGFAGDGTRSYSLDGKETTTEAEGRMGKTLVKSKAELDGGKLKLSSVRVMNTQMGEVSITTKETWTLSGDGKTLTVKREMETPRGTNSSEMVFTKN